jgi:4-hydroxy-tetrahydrodipicolinate reductase
MSSPGPLRLLIVGYGKMGKLIDQLAPANGFEVIERLDIYNNANGEGIDPALAKNIDLAIDFSTADAVLQNLPKLAAAHVNLVIGTTGWKRHEPAMKKVAADGRIGVVAAPNFALGVNFFQGLVERTARLLAPHEEFGAWIHEAHHAAKKDAPSGTALALEQAMREAGYVLPIDMASTRAGSIPGIHTVGFDGPFETITLTHSVRDRAAFARGALEAARWIHGKRGWFTMREVLGLD